jgi:virulence-associated protein VagC
MIEIKRALDEMHLGSETRVLLRVQNDSLLLTPVRVGVPDDELDEVMDDIEERFSDTFNSLAK